MGLWLVKSTSVGPVDPAPFWFTSGTAFGPSNATPFQGDFDGDGYTDLAYYLPSTATWYMDDSQSNIITSFTLGTPNVSMPVVGYFNASGPEEAAVFTNGVWTIANGRNVTFGQAGDIPVPGDYTGVGFDELAVYRPSTGQFLVQVPGTTTPDVISIPGIGGGTPDVPVPGNYNPYKSTPTVLTGALASGSAVVGISNTTGLIVGKLLPAPASRLGRRSRPSLRLPSRSRRLQRPLAPRASPQRAGLRTPSRRSSTRTLGFTRSSAPTTSCLR